MADSDQTQANASHVEFKYEKDKEAMIQRFDFLPEDKEEREKFFNRFLTIMFNS